MALLLVLCIAAGAGAAYALHNAQLTASLGKITSDPSPSPSPSPSPTPTPSNIVITGGTLNSAQYTSLSSDGSTIAFSDSSFMQGATFQLVLTVKNTGETSGAINTPVVSGLGSVATAEAVETYPVALAAGASATLTWNMELVGVGSCTPTITLPLT